MGNVQNVQESLINDMKLSINAVNSCISYDIFMSKPTENSGHFTEFIKLRKVGNCDLTVMCRLFTGQPPYFLWRKHKDLFCLSVADGQTSLVFSFHFLCDCSSVTKRAALALMKPPPCNRVVLISAWYAMINTGSIMTQCPVTEERKSDWGLLPI